MWRRCAEGIDEIDLLCATAPVPCLLMAGELDSVFRIEDTRRLADEAAAFYRTAGYAERFSFFIDKGKGHCYSLDQARQFVMFCRKWLCKETELSIPDIPDKEFIELPYEELRCYPRTDINIRTLAVSQAEKLAAQWDNRRFKFDGQKMRDESGSFCLPQHGALSAIPWRGFLRPDY